ncbi:hypothetical protein LshimejAT787_2600180 [Lyophyllum shimeji]|uniref:Uncharacterized protein n=1 Tax=Lyophyllum shimeji TaxID=47721 RepID=A0A9P3UVA6_LYOSH|nr:hypothetical protein LshimejAT787_2600180 [Lyophyllum shimeji]
MTRSLQTKADRLAQNIVVLDRSYSSGRQTPPPVIRVPSHPAVALVDLPWISHGDILADIEKTSTDLLNERCERSRLSRTLTAI